MDAAERKPWEMTPEGFGKAFAPTRTATHPPGFCYPFADGAAHPTREAAVRAGHRHLVARAIDAGQSVPPAVLDLYPDLAKSEFAELASAAPNDAGTIGALAAAVKDLQARQDTRDTRHQMAMAKAHADAQATLAAMIADAAETRREAERRAANTQTVLAKCLAETEDALKGVVGAALLAHDDAQSLHHHTALALAKAMEAHAREADARAAEFRGELDRVYGALQQNQETLTRILEMQAKAATARPATPEPPKKWTFKVRRDSHGNIEALDATQGTP